jgi:hypothetical protein
MWKSIAIFLHSMIMSVKIHINVIISVKIHMIISVKIIVWKYILIHYYYSRVYMIRAIYTLQ